MKRGNVIAALFTLGTVASCAPDPFLGSYTFTDSQSTMLTQPFVLNSSDNTTGTLIVETGRSADYDFTFTGTGSSDMCLVHGTRSNGAVTFAAGQMCTFHNANGTLVATLTSGSANVADRMLSATLQYTFTGNSGALAVVGTGTQVFTCTRVMN